MAGWTAVQWHGDTVVPFRQEANFWYLSGIEYADWRLIIDGDTGTSWLVAPEIDATHQLFDGGLDHATAKAISGVDEVISDEAGKRLLRELAVKHQDVYTVGVPPYAKQANFALNPATDQLRKELGKLFTTVQDCQKTLSKLRAIKQPLEIETIERAASLSVDAFESTKAALPKCAYEYEVEAELGYHFRKFNAVHAFEPIVASSKNACTLHYVANKSKLESGQLLLIDAGAKVDGYSADITRTYTVGEPTQRQQAVLRAVQLAEQQIVALVRPGLALESYLEAVDAIMKDALMSLGLMKNRKDLSAYHNYFPHAISHGLGIDVHESLGGYKEFRSGMVLTVEPGVYIPEEGTGVRIEDTVLVTDNGCKNLTAALSTDL